MPTSPRTIRPLVPVTTCKPARMRTQPRAETKAPINFMPPAPAFCAGFPSSGLILRKASRLITTTSAPATAMNLPTPVEKYAIPAHSPVSPTMNVVKERPCPVVAAMSTASSTRSGSPV